MAKSEKQRAKERLRAAVGHFNRTVVRKDASDGEIAQAASDVARAEFLADEAGVPNEDMKEILKR